METLEINQLAELVETLEGQNKVKQDIVIPTSSIRYEGGILRIGENDQYGLTELCHEQVSEKLGIPIGYYRRLRTEAPELLEQNINGWLGRKTQTKYLLRTFKYPDVDNVCRAMLSNRYNILDNYDVLLTALKAIKEAGVNVKIQEAKVTEKRMYLHIVAPEIEVQADELLREYIGRQDRAGVGNGIVSGLSISNSEVGLGTFEICPKAMILKCLNGAMDRSAAVKRVHLGAKMDTSVIDWSQGTKNKNFELIMEMVKDSVKVFLSKDYLGELVKKLERAKQVEMEYGIDAVQHIAKEIYMNEEQTRSILNHFIKDGDHSGLGIMQAMTRASQDMHPDTRYEVESKAFSILPNIKKYDKPFSIN